MSRLVPVSLLAALVGLCALAPVSDAARRGHARAKVTYRSEAVMRSVPVRRPRAGRRRSVVLRRRSGAATPRRVATPVPPSAPAPLAQAEPARVIDPVVAPVDEPLGSFASVRARDSAESFSFTLSRSALAAGAVRIQLQNSGEDPHELTIAADGGGAPLASTGRVEPGDYSTVGADLPAGRYRLYCALFNHAQRGMRATLTVR